MKTLVLYEGEVYTVEWYYSASGKSQACEFYQSLNKNRRIQFLKLVKHMGEIGQIQNKTKFRN